MVVVDLKARFLDHVIAASGIEVGIVHLINHFLESRAGRPAGPAPGAKGHATRVELRAHAEVR